MTDRRPSSGQHTKALKATIEREESEMSGMPDQFENLNYLKCRGSEKRTQCIASRLSRCSDSPASDRNLLKNRTIQSGRQDMIAIHTTGSVVTDLPELVERHATGLSDDMIRYARYGYIPSRDELMLAGYYEGRYRPRGWQLREATVFKKLSGSHVLWIRSTPARKPLWILERVGVRTDDDQMLCYAFGPMPILTRSYQAAMWLAEHCHLDTPDNLGLMHWIDADA